MKVMAITRNNDIEFEQRVNDLISKGWKVKWETFKYNAKFHAHTILMYKGGKGEKK